jgi:hypothetical protein
MVLIADQKSGMQKFKAEKTANGEYDCNHKPWHGVRQQEDSAGQKKKKEIGIGSIGTGIDDPADDHNEKKVEQCRINQRSMIPGFS